MNNKRRDLHRLAGDLLDRALGYVTRALDAEQDCLDNMPENLQYSERYEKMEAAIDNLETAVERIDEAKDCLEEASA